MYQSSVIVGTGSYIPEEVVKNKAFLDRAFFSSQGCVLDKPSDQIVEKLEEITGIKERRYVSGDLVASDIAFFAAEDALTSSRIDRETLDYIVVAHNFGDIQEDNRRTSLVPSLAAKVKHKLRISNPYTVAYDLPFGCPGWVQGLIQSHQFMKAGDAKRALIIGAETLSRVSDPHDQDSMIYSDGAGAVILEWQKTVEQVGILSHVSRSDTFAHAHLLQMDTSYHPDASERGSNLFLKMQGHRVYKYALKTVPLVVQESLDKAGIHLDQISKVLIHQANEKMDDDILKRLFSLNGNKNLDRATMTALMPITISWLGNSSVATIPTLLDLIAKNKLNGHHIASGDVVILASVGAGMNINSVVYKAA
ncbi:MAG: ketoacyl-ACP synthase III [Myxococcota bacterium]|nr:ketoacyl-ACP synthase III [Myxococcota bacterium]